MTKEQFLYALRMRLSQLHESEIQKSLSYYDEMISDLMDDGMTEYEAVDHIGDVGEVAEQILSEQPLSTLIKTKVKPRRGWTPLAIVIGRFVKQADETLTVHAPDCTVMFANVPES